MIPYTLLHWAKPHLKKNVKFGTNSSMQIPFLASFFRLWQSPKIERPWLWQFPKAK